MSKSMLVIDTPSRCGECPIHASIQLHAWAEREYWCPAANNKDVDRDKKPSWCPLKSVTENIDKLDIHPTEAIVVRFNPNEIYLDEVEEWCYIIHSKFPNNALIAIPDAINLESCSKDVLENYISMIAEIIEEL